MKNNFEILMKYFRKKYNPKTIGGLYTLVADELCITPRHLRNILDGKSKAGASLDKLSARVARELKIEDLSN
jgi:predicted transcriptional regulator